MTYKHALKQIFSAPRTAGKPTLARMSLLCEYLGNPQSRLRFVHIAGTNGKGSCAAMLTSVLEEAGYRVGRFISPYVLDFRERIEVGGKMISRQELTLLFSRVASAADRLRADILAARAGRSSASGIPAELMEDGVSAELVQFELVTALGFLYFFEKNCDIVVLECGLGGKYDATNVIGAPLAAVIMEIGLDHTELLGGTVSAIAGEKCGIIKRGCGGVVSYPQSSSEARAAIKAACAKNGCANITPDTKELYIKRAALGGLEFEYRAADYKTSMCAVYQAENACTVLETVALLRRSGMNIPQAAAEGGLLRAQLAGRFEVFSIAPAVIADGAHNASGIEALVRSLTYLSKRPAASGRAGGHVNMIIGMNRDKNPAEALLPMIRAVKSGEINPALILTASFGGERSMPGTELAEIISDMLGSGSPKVRFGGTPEETVLAAYDVTGEEDTLLCFGSLFLVAELRPILQKEARGR